MKNPIADYLEELIQSHTGDDDGEPADYIPDLAAVRPDTFGIAVTTIDGHTYAAGDADHEFTIQSISKPFAYAAALMDQGLGALLEVVGVEPSGEAFNELSLEGDSKRPRNPMINAGAIAVHQQLVSSDATPIQRVDRMVEFLSELAGRQLRINEGLVESELSVGHRNLAIAHMLRNYDIIHDDPHDIVEGYTRQCAIDVTARDISMMAATLASGGVHPLSQARVIDSEAAAQTLAVMASCGMYDGSGEWLARVGIPAKSGVSGGITGALPGQVGIGTISPRLDSVGNSVRGVRVFEQLSRDMGMNLMVSESYGSNVLRSVTAEGDETIYLLQGVIEFSGSESVLHHMDSHAEDLASTVVLDLTRVDRFKRVGRRMMLEGLRRLSEHGHKVAIIDPDGVLPEPELGDGGSAAVRIEPSRTHADPDD